MLRYSLRGSKNASFWKSAAATVLSMKPKEMLAELESAAHSIDVKVSYEAIASSVLRGGLCKVKGKYRVIIDKRLTPEERANTLAESLARFDFSQFESIAKSAQSLLNYYSARRLQRLA